MSEVQKDSEDVFAGIGIFFLIKLLYKFSRNLRLKSARSTLTSPGPIRVKGTHAWDFQSLLQNFFGTFQSLTDTKQSTDNQHFRKISFEFAQIFKICYYSLFSPKACSMNKRCRRKLGVKLSIFSSQLCVSGLFWAFLAKKWSQTLHFWWKRGVKLIVVGENV